MRYVYVGGRFHNDEFAVLAFEPDIFGTDVKVLLANGEVRTMSSSDVRHALETDGRRP